MLKEYKHLDEKIYEFDHSSGVHVQVIPKPGFYKKFAICALNFGSVNTKFILPGTDTVTKVPEGIAHFLEHKMFEQPDVNVMDQYMALGASTNAATSFNWTYYYFNCTENFDDCFRLLMKFVQKPYFTEENVEKEKGIIAQEINMYKDEPEYRVSMNAINLLYHKNPVKNDIAGTVESVNSITAEMLGMCHRTFYSPSNMVITVVGDLDPAHIESLINEGFCHATPTQIPEFVFEDEPDSVAGPQRVEIMDVALPLFSFALKDKPVSVPMKQIYRQVAGNIVQKALFGSTSQFHEDMYNRGLINSEFYADYDCCGLFSMASIGGESENPELLKNCVQEYVGKMLKFGLPEESCINIRNAGAGSMLKRFNNPASLGKMFATSYLAGIDPFDYFDAYGKISYDYIMEVFREIYSGDMVTSIVKGKE